MEREKYLIIESYKGKQIRIIVDEVWESGNLIDVSVSNSSNGLVCDLGVDSETIMTDTIRYLTEDDVCDVVFNEFELAEKSIDKKKKESYNKSKLKTLDIYTVYLGELIEVKAFINYYKKQVCWVCMGETHHCPFGIAISSIKNNINECRHIIEHQYLVKKRFEYLKRGYTVELLRQMRDSLKINVLIKKYPELY